MPLPLSMTSFVTLSGFTTGVFLGVVFFSLPGGMRKANRILGLLLIVLAALSLGAFFAQAGWFRIYPKTQRMYAPLFFSLGPLFYLYANALFRPFLAFRPLQCLHFTGVAAYYALNIPFYLKSDSEKIALLTDSLSMHVRGIRIVALIHFCVYVWLVWRVIIKGYREACDQLSSLDRLKVRWVGYVAAVYATVLLVNTWPQFNWQPVDQVLIMWEALIVYVLGFLGIRQLAGHVALSAETQDQLLPVPLDDHELTPHLRAITRVMEEDKVYLDPNLTLDELARYAGVKAYLCSGAINTMLGMNFFSFVNQYRIDEALRQLRTKDANRTILEVAFASGFNAKSTFNALFKAKTGLTPSQYLRSHADRAPARTSDGDHN